jgi:hypothetical protein
MRPAVSLSAALDAAGAHGVGYFLVLLVAAEVMRRYGVGGGQ